jgi:hypothetical protein
MEITTNNGIIPYNSAIALIFVCVFVCSCSEMNYFQDDGSDNQMIAMPEELWLKDALEYVYEANSQPESLLLKAQVAQNGITASIFFNNATEVYKLTVKDSLQSKHDYFFLEGLLSYSTHHLANPDEPSWLVAYAQNRPYAACANYEHETDRVNANYTQAPLNMAEVREVVRLVELLEARENSHFYDKRVDGKREFIKDALSPDDTEKIYAVNTAKGDKLRVSLSSVSPYLFFNIFPNNGTNMEHKIWEGSATVTGDLVIKVFSAGPKLSSEPFELLIEKL